MSMTSPIKSHTNGSATKPSSSLNTLHPEKTIEQGRRVIKTEITALEDLSNRLDMSFVRAIELMEQCTGRVVVTGMGKSGHIGRKIAATLASVGTPSTFMHPAEGAHGDLGLVTPDDVVIAISNSGETQELLGVLPTLNKLKVPVISMTGRLHSTLARRGTVTLDISVAEEACPLGLAPTSSTTVTLALGDALALVLLERKGFTKEDFALFHPAGALGKRLLLQVGDVMHAGDEMPTCTPDTPLVEALVEMTSKQMGMTLVMSAQKELLGLVTDSDVRRSLQDNQGDIRNIVLSDVMTSNPKTILESELAIKALRMMEEKTLQCIVVVNEMGRPVGALHLYDLLKAGIE
jgi:arabinose-5-phosphate isomerase